MKDSNDKLICEKCKVPLVSVKQFDAATKPHES